MYEEFDRSIQELIKLMKANYPDGYELVLTSNGATIRSTQPTISFVDNSIKNLTETEKREVR